MDTNARVNARRRCLKAGIDPETKIVDLTEEQIANFRRVVGAEQQASYLREATMNDFRDTPCSSEGCDNCYDASEVARLWAKELNADMGLDLDVDRDDVTPGSFRDSMAAMGVTQSQEDKDIQDQLGGPSDVLVLTLPEATACAFCGGAKHGGGCS